MNDRTSLRFELFGAWCAPIFSVLTVIGFLGFGHFYHPAAADLSPKQLAGFYAEHQTAVELGMSLFCLATAFLTVYSVQLGLWLWRAEGRSPLMALSQMFAGFGIVMLIFISCCLWIGAAYRADTANPDVVVALNDAAWFGFLVGWVILSLQMAVTAAITLAGHNGEPLVPRWVAWAAVVGAIALATANGCAFTKTGTFAWDGLWGFYIPMVIWGLWLDGYALVMRAEIKRRMRSGAATAAVGAPSVLAGV
jgi:hypothetical protein